MKKRISFFSIVINIILVIGLLITIFFIAFGLVSFVSFDKKEEQISIVSDVEIYQREKISSFSAHFNFNNLVLEISTKKKEEYLFFMEYALHYFDIYKTAINLEANNIDSLVYVTINKSKEIVYSIF